MIKHKQADIFPNEGKYQRYTKLVILLFIC